MKRLQGPLFIVFEGIDGSGKSTQAALLHRMLLSLGGDTVLLREPTAGRWGVKIREMLGGEAALDPEKQVELFMLDREEDARDNIRPALEQKKIVVMDRYYYSNAAYQGAGGLDPFDILAKNRGAGFPAPDRVYLIEVSPECAIERIVARSGGGAGELFERGPCLERVREIYLSIADEKFCIIDGSRDQEEIFRDICDDLRVGAFLHV